MANEPSDKRAADPCGPSAREVTEKKIYDCLEAQVVELSHHVDSVSRSNGLHLLKVTVTKSLQIIVTSQVDHQRPFCMPGVSSAFVNVSPPACLYSDLIHQRSLTQ